MITLRRKPYSTENLRSTTIPSPKSTVRAIEGIIILPRLGGPCTNSSLASSYLYSVFPVIIDGNLPIKPIAAKV
jgi:hypothetical protein